MPSIEMMSVHVRTDREAGVIRAELFCGDSKLCELGTLNLFACQRDERKLFDDWNDIMRQFVMREATRVTDGLGIKNGQIAVIEVDPKSRQ